MLQLLKERRADSYKCLSMFFTLPFVLTSFLRGDIQGTVVRIIVVIISIMLHELGHGLAAYHFGDRTAYQAGRLTLNPLAHFDILGLVMILFAPIGWAKPVPFNPNNFKERYRNRWAVLAVSLAGITVNFILAFIGAFLATGLFFLDRVFIDVNFTRIFLLFCQNLYIVNLGLLCFNILPFPPLDGFRIWSVFLSRKVQYFLESHSNQFMLILVVLILAGRNFLLNRLIQFIAEPFQNLIMALLKLIFN